MTTEYVIRGVDGKLISKGILDKNNSERFDILNDFNTGYFKRKIQPYNLDVLTKFYVLDGGDKTFVRLLSNGTIKTNCELEMGETSASASKVLRITLTEGRDRAVIGILDNNRQKIGTIGVRNLKSKQR